MDIQTLFNLQNIVLLIVALCEIERAKTTPAFMSRALKTVAWNG